MWITATHRARAATEGCKVTEGKAHPHDSSRTAPTHPPAIHRRSGRLHRGLPGRACEADCLSGVEAGTEVFTGKAQLDTTAYSVNVDRPCRRTPGTSSRTLPLSLQARNDLTMSDPSHRRPRTRRTAVLAAASVAVAVRSAPSP